MTKETFKPFSEFWEEIKNPNTRLVEIKTEAEIIEDVNKILNQFKT
jgi:restriction endonuclease